MDKECDREVFMKVAIIRGPFLNKWEMQNYEPLVGEIDVMAYYSDNNLYDVSQITLPKRRFRSIERVLSFTGIHFYHYMFGLESQLKGIDIAHTSETYNGFSYQAIRAKENYGTKVVVTQWENIPHLGEEKLIVRKIKEKVRLNADLLIAITERAKQALFYEGVPEERISVIPMGVDIEIFKPTEKNELFLSKLGLNKEDVIVLFVGRLVWEKGIFDLIYAFKKILMDEDLRKKNIHLVLVGKGDTKNIKELKNKLGVSTNVHLVGNFPYEQMPIIYNLADIFVLPSIPTSKWQEQFGMAIIEAMACGKPVISTFCGSIPEVVGNAGILVQPNDILSLYYELKKIIQNEGVRDELSKAARLRVERLFRAQKVAEVIKKEYEKLLG